MAAAHVHNAAPLQAKALRVAIYVDDGVAGALSQLCASTVHPHLEVTGIKTGQAPDPACLDSAALRAQHQPVPGIPRPQVQLLALLPQALARGLDAHPAAGRLPQAVVAHRIRGEVEVSGLTPREIAEPARLYGQVTVRLPLGLQTNVVKVVRHLQRPPSRRARASAAKLVRCPTASRCHCMWSSA